MLVVLDRAVTVDQPPLAVGVRFPLCPPISSITTGRSGPSLVFYAEMKEAADCAKGIRPSVSCPLPMERSIHGY